MEKTNILFNEASEAYKAKLSAGDRAALETMEKKHEEQRQALIKDHQENKDQRIAALAKKLDDDQRSQRDGPRPKGVIVHLKSSAELAMEARSQIKRAHTQKLQAMFDDGKKAERAFVKKALGIEDQSAHARTIGHKTDLLLR